MKLSSQDSKELKGRTQALNYYTLEGIYYFKEKIEQQNKLIGKVKSRTANNKNQNQTKGIISLFRFKTMSWKILVNIRNMEFTHKDPVHNTLPK